MFALIARGVTRFPWLVIAVWLVAGLGITVAAPRLTDITTNDQAAFLPASAESAQAAALARKAFPETAGTLAMVVVSRPGGQLSDADLAVVAGLANQPRPNGVTTVYHDPLQMVSPNRQVAIVAVQFTGGPEHPLTRAAVWLVRADVNRALAGTGLVGQVTGEAAISVDNRNAFHHAEFIVTIAAIGLIALLLLLIFRSPVAAALPLATVGLVYGLSAGLVSCLGRAGDWLVGPELPTLLTVVLFGIGTDYVVFLLFRYRERLRSGDSPREAIVAAMARVGRAIACAGGAVIAAFAALLIASLGYFTTLGPSLAIAVAVMVAASLTLVPAAIAVLGRWVFWPRTGTEPAKRWRWPRRALAARTGAPAGRVASGGGYALLARLITRWPVAVIAAGSILLAGLGAGLSRLHPSYDPIDQLPGHTESTAAFRTLEQGFPAGALAPTDIYLHSSTPLAVEQIAEFAGELATVKDVISPGLPITSADGRTVRLPVIVAPAPFSAAALDLVSGPLREAAHRAAPPGVEVLVGGQSMALADVRQYTQRDLKLIFILAAALFLLILIGLLRALLAPLYLVALVVLAFVAAMGAAGWIYGATLSFTIPIVLYLFVTAIGTDYNILIGARMREEIAEGRSPRVAAGLAVARSGPAVAAAALILAGTFAALLVSGLPFFVQIGCAVTAGILVVSFVGALLLVPAVIALTGRAAWWPGRSRRGQAHESADPLMEKASLLG